MPASPDHPLPSSSRGTSDQPPAQKSPDHPLPTRSAEHVAEGLPPVSPDFVEQDFPDEMDNIVPTRGYQMLPTVGLGGSAGSIPALQKFFAEMPAESGMAFVVILHLSTEHESILPELLGRTTTMPVVAAEDGRKLLANHVYVIPPGKFLALTDGHLRLTELEKDRGKRVVVDLFFRTLADTHGPHAAAIILSGADGDGALGIKRVKERGGLTVGQDPDEAEHSSMPRTAIDTGMVDWVLRVEEMPARLMQYFETEQLLQLPSEEGPQPAKPPELAPDEEERTLREVLTFLRTRTGRDFTYYKRATIVRRISRRMQVNGQTTLRDYLVFMRTHPGEAGALQADMLISVTNFFRDRDSFDALEARLPRLFEGKATTDALRVWVAACATGEEAYSIAMMLMEHAATLDSPPIIQVFATDLDEEVIATAREGLYPLTIAADVSEERLRRFFIKEHRGYRARRELRESVLFAVHDLLKDAPFSRLDLVTCRNLLIYLNQDAQQRVFEIFHFALRREGWAFLGSSESVDDESALFSTLDKKARLYQQRPVPRPGLPVPIGPSTITRAVEAQKLARKGPFIHGLAFSASSHAAVQRDAELHNLQQVSWEELHFKLIERFAPPSLIVTRDYEIVHVSENAGQFLHFSSGEPSVNLLKVVHPMLRVELRAALFRAAQTNVPVEVFRVPLERDGVVTAIDIRVAPAQEVAPDYLLVVFSEREAGDAAAVQTRLEAEPAVRHLEREIEQMKTRLRDTVEQYEASAEELKASNEELQAMNEELRSAAEELETSREELQSINEELSTVNLELKGKVDELARANSDLSNFMSATGVATIFLDRHLRITRYTPAAVSVFRLIASDVGRPLTDLANHLNYADLKADAERVLDTLAPSRREVLDREGRWFLAQLLPYRTSEDRIAGVVLTFVDVTETREAEQALVQSKERLRLIMENAREYAILSADLDRRVTSWNIGAQRLLGYTEEEILGQPADVIFTPEDAAAGVPAFEADKAIQDGRAADERWHVRKDGSRFWGSGSMMSMHDGDQKVIGLLKIFRDQTAAREAQLKLEANERELWEALQEMERARETAEAATRAKDHFLAVLSHELRTPLTPVLMAVQTLARLKDLPPIVSEALEMILRNVRLEARFIDELLDVTKIERGKLELLSEELELHSVIRQAVEVCTPDLEAKKIQFTCTLTADDTRLHGDPTRLQQVFWNLLKNAAKFTPEKGRIDLRTHNEAQRIVVTITDNGIGFSPDAAERIFDAFGQAEPSVTQRFGGLGLGLAIAKATIDGHGGKLLAISPGPHQGATFTVELPVPGGPRAPAAAFGS